MKKVILVSILLIPSLIYFFIELTQANFKKMAYYGPKKLDQKGDTIYYSLPRQAFEIYALIREQRTDSSGNEILVDVQRPELKKHESFIAMFVEATPGRKSKYTGLLDYIKFKEKEAKEVPVVFIMGDDRMSGPDYPFEKGKKNRELNLSKKYLNDSIGIKLDNFLLLSPTADEQVKDLQRIYFEGKPVYIMEHFAVLVDSKGQIRGYYDPDQFGEVKRMVQEYKHLVLREEHKKMEQSDKIERAQ
ncbi:MAG: hypothetical protein ACJ76F_05035 [Bacteroidia bacterium]